MSPVEMSTQVTCLIALGGRLEAVTAQGHGVIELAALGRHVHILDHLIQTSFEDSSTVWKRLASFAASHVAEEAESTIQVGLM